MSKVRNALLLLTRPRSCCGFQRAPTAAEAIGRAALMEQNNSGASGSAVLAASASAAGLRQRRGGR